MDRINRPYRTKLPAAEARDCRNLSGGKMPVWQGVQAVKIWTGAEAPAAIMEQALLQALDEKISGKN